MNEQQQQKQQLMRRHGQGLLKIAVPNFIVWILGFYRRAPRNQLRLAFACIRLAEPNAFALHSPSRARAAAPTREPTPRRALPTRHTTRIALEFRRMTRVVSIQPHTIHSSSIQPHTTAVRHSKRLACGVGAKGAGVVQSAGEGAY